MFLNNALTELINKTQWRM